MKLVWLLWWSALLSCGHSSPGVVMRVTQKWLDYILSEGKDVFRHILQRDHLPDVIGSTRVFGQVDYAITGISVQEFNPSHTVAVPTPPTDVLLNVEGAMATVSGQWRVKHWLINDNGNFTLRISGVILNAWFTTSKDSAARPSVSLSLCNSEVTKAKVHLSGGASWFYNLFTGFLEKPIRDNLNEKLCPRVGDVIKILQKELATFQVAADIDGRNTIDYSLVNPPRVQKTSIELDLKGTIRHIGAEEQQEASVPPIILPDAPHSMILVGWSEYFFNALGKTYFMSDILQMTFTQRQYPHVLWLKTDDYAFIIPKIKQYYPESRAVTVTVKASRPPAIVLTSQLTMQLQGTLEAHVIVGPHVPAEQMFSATVRATLVANMVHLSNLSLNISFSIQSFDFQDFRSYVGLVDITGLESSLGHMLLDYVVRAINSGLSQGIPMPSLNDIILQESAVSIIPGCLLMSMDMYYTPWRELVKILPEHGSP
ncbi:bactericidal permeability-increasing protein-like [Dendropsophus ebraccatus]|uniref:bactericidal permeability-increasing protein-like n=1 Tax=Dendropsophus ebraccatus TaxID=150705 RepID=UPI0038312B86